MDDFTKTDICTIQDFSNGEFNYIYCFKFFEEFLISDAVKTDVKFSETTCLESLERHCDLKFSFYQFCSRIKNVQVAEINPIPEPQLIFVPNFDKVLILLTTILLANWCRS